MPRLVAAGACALLLAVSAAARSDDPTSSAAPAPRGPQRAQLDLRLNEVAKGVVLVVLVEGDVLVQPADLESAGLAGVAGRRRLLFGKTWVSLRSLDPDVVFEVDEAALALRLTARPTLLGKTLLDLRPSARPEGMVERADTSGFLNYAAQLRSDGQLTGFAEAGASHRGHLLYSGISLLGDGRAARGLSSLTLNEPGELRRWVVGDTVAAAGGMGGSAVVGGLSVFREFSLDPYLIRAPLPRTAGFATTPSTLDVYVNGLLVRQIPVTPGTFELANLPVTAGSGSVRTELRDAFGRTEVLDSRTYYYSSGLLAKGLSDFGYHLGFRRGGFGSSSFDYGAPVLVARHRLGLAGALTGGLRLEGGPDTVSGGPSVTLGLPVGELELSAAGSASDHAPGTAGSVAYSWLSRRVSAGAFVRGQSARYATVSLRPVDDRASIQVGTFVGLPIGKRLTATVEYTGARYRDAGISQTVSVRGDASLLPGLALSVAASEQRAAPAASGLGFFASLSWSVASSTVAAATAQGGQGSDPAGGVQLQRSLPVGPGYGYRLHAGGGPNEPTGAVVQAQSSFGRYEVSYDRLGPGSVGYASASGGAVVIDRKVFFSRPIQDGFALIQVAGVEGVRGYLENQEVGRTDRDGDLLVPALQPYYGNRLSISEKDIPFAYDVRQVERVVSAPQRGGALVRFDVRPVRTVNGRIVVERDGEVASPAYGELTVSLDGRAASPIAASPLAGDGRFCLENVAAGRYHAVVEYSGGRCLFELEVPSSSAARVELGELRCRASTVLARHAAQAP